MTEVSQFPRKKFIISLINPLEVPKLSERGDVWRKMRPLLTKPSFAVFLTFAALNGALNALPEIYLFRWALFRRWTLISETDIPTQCFWNLNSCREEFHWFVLSPHETINPQLLLYDTLYYSHLPWVFSTWSFHKRALSWTPQRPGGVGSGAGLVGAGEEPAGRHHVGAGRRRRRLHVLLRSVVPLI